MYPKAIARVKLHGVPLCAGLAAVCKAKNIRSSVAYRVRNDELHVQTIPSYVDSSANTYEDPSGLLWKIHDPS